MDFSKRVVLVTGGAKGIGQGICLEYLKAGATVVVADVDDIAGRAIEMEWKRMGYPVLFYPIDLTKVEEIQKMFEEIAVSYKKVDILINNAGVSKFKSLYDLTLEDWESVLNTNLRSMVFTAQQFAFQNRGTEYGRIINISSTRHLMSEPDSEAYAASKGGIVSLTHALALSLSKEKITVNCISPGWIQNTNYESLKAEDHHQHPSLRVGKPEDIAKACLFLSEEDNDFINGQNLVIDGGMTKKMIYIE